MDEVAQREVRRRARDGEPTFKLGDVVLIESDHAFQYRMMDTALKDLKNVPRDVYAKIGWDRYRLRLTAWYIDDATRVCNHEEHWILVKPVRA